MRREIFSFEITYKNSQVPHYRLSSYSVNDRITNFLLSISRIGLPDRITNFFLSITLEELFTHCNEATLHAADEKS